MNPLIKMLTDALSGCGPVTLGAMIPEGLPDVVAVGIRFGTPAEAEALVKLLDTFADVSSDQVVPDHQYIHPAPDRVQ